MTIPSTLLARIVDAAGQHLVRLAVDQVPKVLPIHPEDMAQAVRLEVERAVDALDMRALVSEEVERIVEREVDVDRAFDELREDVERDLRREAETIDIEEMAQAAVSESLSEVDIILHCRQAVVTLVGDHREAVVQAAGTALAEAVVAGAAAQG